MKFPYMQFFPGDWLKDPALGICTPAARGVWIDLLCAMHESDRSGTLRGTREQLARVARCSTVELTQALTELQQNRVGRIEYAGEVVTVISPRMAREAAARSTPGLRYWVRQNYGRLLQILSRRQGSKCARCGSTQDLQIDHIKAIARGGDNALKNLQLLCGTCNRRKHAN